MPKLTPDQQKSRAGAILMAAERCFLRRGFHSTTMQDICKEAGVSAGAIYVYFRSKEALVAGLAAAEQEEILERFGKLHESADFISGLEAMLTCCLDEQTPQRTALLLEIIAESTRNAELREILRRVDSAINGKVQLHFERAQRECTEIPASLFQRLGAFLPVFIDGLMLRKAMDPDFDQQAVACGFIADLRAEMQRATPLIGGGELPAQKSRHKSTKLAEAV